MKENGVIGMNGLQVINIELTSRCNKNCWMCGRRKIDKEYPEIAMNYGDMKLELLENIAEQIPGGIVIQFHNNGEPTLYPNLGYALKMFEGNIRNFDTNGKLLLEKSNEIIGNLETLTISVFERDPEGDEQYNIVKEFLKIKGDRKPHLIYRLLGDVSNPERWYELPGIVATRILHHPLGNYEYKKRHPSVPEIGICLDLLGHLVIDKDGLVYPCVRFDPKKENVIGDINIESLEDIWYGEKRANMIDYHLKQRRDLASPLCKECQYWGVPTGL